MKNLKKTFLDHRLDRVIFLSRREAKFLAGQEPRRYYNRPGLYHATNGVDVYKRIYNVLKKFIGRNVNDAFECFSAFVPWYQKKIFWDQVEKYRHHSKYYHLKFFISSDGIIHSAKRKIQPVVYKSLDYVEEYQHKINHRLITDSFWEFRDIDKSEFKKVCISGFKKTFSSKRDPRYIKLVAQDRKTLKKQKRNEYKKYNEDLLNIFNESLSQSYRTKNSN